jgi:hypothetical protein
VLTVTFQARKCSRALVGLMVFKKRALCVLKNETVIKDETVVNKDVKDDV